MEQLSFVFPDPATIPVGYLVADVAARTGHLVACASCTACRATPIYHVNIYPYKQTCCDCGKTLVQGQSPAWCELFVPRQSEAVAA